jgi:hypothetical protein
VCAQFEIYHSGRDLVAKLQRKFPPHDAGALRRSLVFSGNRAAQQLVLYAFETRDYRLIFYPAANDQLQIVVEPLETQMRRACEHVWRSVRRGSRWHHVRLASLRVLGPSGDTVASATTGWRSTLARRDLWPAFAVALTTVAWLLIALSTFGGNEKGSIVEGAIPSMVIGTAAFIALVAHRTRLVWRLEGWEV